MDRPRSGHRLADVQALGEVPCSGLDSHSSVCDPFHTIAKHKPGWRNGRRGGLKIPCLRTSGFDSRPRYQSFRSQAAVRRRRMELEESWRRCAWCRSPARMGPSRSSSGRSPSRAPDRCGSRCRPAASATAIRSPRKELFPGIQYPRVPGHEVAGVIDAVGAGVAGWQAGPAGRRRLERRLLRALRPLPPRRLLRLRDRPGHRHHVRRRLRAST